MADDRGRGLAPPRDGRDESYLPPVHAAAEDRTRGYHPRLPPIHDHGAPQTPAPYPPQSAPSRYPPPTAAMDPRDSRASANYGPSPGHLNDYQPPPPPPQPAPHQGQQYHMPPVAADPRAPPQPPYDAYRQHAPPFTQPGYEYRGPQSLQGYADPRTGGYGQEYGRGPMPNQPQLQAGAPRQRTSIACKYCRRRKIRCSGYQNSPGGKCTNCLKMNQECVFQPVSSSTSTAFVPISAVQGTLAPGTQLYGAYGQPLTPSQPGPGAGEYPHPMQSPTAQYPPVPFDGNDRRRPREDEEAMAPRLPPPTTYQEQDSRRRSPATSGTDSPGTYSSYPPPAGPYEGGGSTPNQRASPGSAAPAQPVAAAPGVMSLGNIIDGPSRSESSIDQNMLSRLGRPSR